MKKYQSLIIILVCLFTPFLAANAQYSSIELKQPTIIINPEIYYPFDEVLYIEGRSQPKGVVEVRLQKSAARPMSFSVRADANGEWVLAEKVPLEAGDWEARARAIGKTPAGDEIASEWSNPRIFKVIVNGITIGGVNIKFAALSLVIAFLLMLGIALVVYFSLKVRKLNSALLEKEIEGAKETVHEGFSELKKDVLDELHALEISGKQLAPEELARKEHLLRELERMEHGMEKEIGDISRRI
ncbi:hypothetical protein HYT01_03410 [Candidatus Giovannonibacteria bacterium]|nr:hypothetical protein [Candidatus Giovannonibacteria bacterium]